LIGEFLVVAVGVLAALGVDAWQDSRREHALAQQYLHALADDLVQDSAILSLIDSILTQKEVDLTILRSVADGSDPNVSPDSTINLLYPSALLGWRLPAIRSAAYTELISSGGLGLIDDVELRSGLVSYYEEWDHQIERLDRHRSTYPDLVYQLLPPEVDRDGAAYSGDVEALMRRVRTDTFRAQVNHEANYARTVSEVMALLAPQHEGLLEAVRRHLE